MSQTADSGGNSDCTEAAPPDSAPVKTEPPPIDSRLNDHRQITLMNGENVSYGSVDSGGVGGGDKTSNGLHNVAFENADAETGGQSQNEVIIKHYYMFHYKRTFVCNTSRGASRRLAAEP